MFNNLKNDFPFEGGGVNDQAHYNEVNVDGRPLWFDPIFLEVFEELKLRYLYIELYTYLCEGFSICCFLKKRIINILLQISFLFFLF